MLEREEAEGNGIVVEKDGEMIAAAVAVGKWESRGLGGISTGISPLATAFRLWQIRMRWQFPAKPKLRVVSLFLIPISCFS